MDPSKIKSHGTIPGSNQGPSPAELLAKMPRRPLTVDQQAAALEKVQQQANQRVKLGQQLFEAADARLKQHQKVLDEINDQQRILREQVQEDVAKSLQSYDQWMGRIDESFTKSVRDLTQRLDQLEERIDGSQQEMQAMVAKAGALLQQTQTLLAETFGDADEIAEAMQDAANESHGYDLDALTANVQPGLDQPADEDGPETIEVDIVQSTDETGMPEALDEPVDGEDIFGQVLRRLREEGDDGNAAA